MSLVQGTGYAFAALAVIAISYQLIALLALRRFFAKPAAIGASPTAVTLLKPLHGAEPQLEANLASFLGQNHAGSLQLVCGTGEANDTAIPALDALRRAFPETDIAISTGQRLPGANAKIGNVCAMMPLARHDVLILSDSDMVVGPDYLAMLLAALEQPGVGAVTCLYTGRGDAGFWSKISAAAISYTGMVNMVMGQSTALAQPCLGSTIAIRRETLAEIGGFERFADVLADDHALGEALGELGLKVAVPPMLLTHACADTSFGELWRHHLRWSATIRGVAPKRHAGSGITHALAFALLTMPFLPKLGIILTATALMLRMSVARKVEAIAAIRQGLIWLLPLADCLEFGVFLASLVTRKIDWRGSELRIMGRGRIAHENPGQTDIP